MPSSEKQCGSTSSHYNWQETERFKETAQYYKKSIYCAFSIRNGRCKSEKNVNNCYKQLFLSIGICDLWTGAAVDVYFMLSKKMKNRSTTKNYL
jgi:hypothetical protein